MKATILFLLMTGVLAAQVSDLRVTGVTATQAVISYTAPNESACTVEVSEQENYASLVHDVNPTLYPGSSSDSRAEAVRNGRERIFVAGERRFDEASDGERYSRALQADTQHYVRVTCGSEQATTTFTTSTVMLGNTRIELPYEVRPASTTGQIWFPTRSLTDRNFSFIDPHTGVLVKNLALPGDISKAVDSGFGFSSASGTNWTSPDNIRAAGGGTADYDGSSCAGSTDCDWLLLTNTYTSWDTAENVDYITVSLTGSGSDATDANRQVELCVVFAGTSCAADSVRKIITLPTSGGMVTAGSTNAGDNWLYSYAGVYGTGVWNTNGGFKIALRKMTNVGTISLDLAQWGDGRSLPTRTGSGGNTDRCGTVADAEGFYFCTGFQGNGSSPSVYRIHGETGEVRYLGIIPTVFIPGSGAEGCSSEYANWDRTAANIFYCTVKGGLYRYQYSGNGVNKAIRYASSQSDWTVTSVVTSISTAVKTFVEAHPDKYPAGYDAAKFGCSLVETKNNGRFAATCTRGSQDSYGWLAVLDSTGVAIAAWEFYKHPMGRWCAIHSSEIIGGQDVFMIATQVLKESGTAGGGPYRTTITNGIDAFTATIPLASLTPTASQADTTIYSIAVGDVFTIDGEWLRVEGINGTTLTVQRARNGSSAASHSSGAIVEMRCATPPGANHEAYIAFHPVWRYLDDPFGEDLNGNFIWVNAYNGHMTTRGHLAVAQPAFAVGTPGTDLFYSTKNPTFNTSFSNNPKFAGVSPGTPGLTFQTHPTFHNVNDTTVGRNYWLDVRPFVGGGSVNRNTPGCDPAQPNYPAANGCAAARVAGTSNIYKYTRAGNLTAEAGLETTTKLFPHYAVAGANRHFQNVSGPGSVITDTDHYKLCEAMLAGECIAGSSPGDVYIVIPNKTNLFYCTGGETFGGAEDICVLPQQQQGTALIQAGAIIPQANAMYSRVLARSALGMANRAMAQTENAKALPSGKWAMATSYVQRQDVVLVKLPTVIVDSKNRSTFQALTVEVPSTPAGTNNVVAEFGYSTNFRCNENRADRCLAVSSTLNETNPYRYPGEGNGGVESGLSGVPCTSSCSVTIPVLPGRVVYYRIKYQDDSGTEITSSLPQVVAVN